MKIKMKLPELQDGSFSLDGKFPRSFARGDFVEGKILKVLEDAYIVDVGGRSEGIVVGRHMKLDGKKLDLKEGDSTLFYVLSPEGPSGLIALSIRNTGQELKWHKLFAIKEKGIPVRVRVVEANTGGVLVEIFDGIRGFIPSSQLNNGRVFTSTEYQNKVDARKNLLLKLTELIGEEIEAKISEIDREKSRVILSERLLQDDNSSEKKVELLAKLKVGDQLEGEVTGIAPFGLFVNAGGVEGLVHLSEISWNKVINPGDYYKIGDRVKVEVIGLQDNKKKVAYSIKRTQTDNWHSVVANYKVGQIVKGVVSSIVDYGVFVRLESGINGLVHISELSSRLVRDPHSVVEVGQTVDVMIITISNEDRHLGLSLKRVSSSKVPSAVSSEPEKVVVTKRELSDTGREIDTLKDILSSEQNA